MLKNYLLTAFRLLWRQRLYSFIHILGLALGLACALMVYIYVQDELSYDTQFAKADRIYRITNNFTPGNTVDKFALTPMNLGPVVKQEYEQAEEVVRVYPANTQQVNQNGTFHQLDQVLFADSNFFQLFDYEFVVGNPRTALRDVGAIVLTETSAQRLFGSAEAAIGKLITFTRRSYKVTAVLRQGVVRSHLPFDAVISFASLPPQMLVQAEADWMAVQTYTYVLLRKGQDAASFEKSLQQLVTKYVEPWKKKYSLKIKVDYHLQPILDLHLRADNIYDYIDKGNASYLYIFGLVGLFILLIACINYVNLTTAQSARRHKEIGIRMVAGAGRGQLFAQFMGESLLFAVLAGLLALCLAEAFLPYYASLTGKFWLAGWLWQGSTLLMLGLLVAGTGILAGLYPSLILSSHSTSTHLRPKAGAAGRRQLLRKALVVSQFVLSIGMIICTLIVAEQMSYMRDKALGFDKDQILILNLPPDPQQVDVRTPESRAQEIARIAGITGTSFCEHIPGEPTGRLVFWVRQEGKEVELPVAMLWADYNYLQFLNVPLAQGRYFSKDYATDDSAAFIINRATARQFGWKEPLGQRMRNGAGYDGKVVGVVEDFHFASLHNTIEPLVIMVQPYAKQRLLVRLQAQNAQQTREAVVARWKQLHPGKYIEERMLTDVLYKQYVKEEKLLEIFVLFTSLMIFISCLGLYGLALFSATQRTKEVGIRKVYGATTRQIVLLLAADFLRLVLWAIPPACLLAWLAMDRWLQDFAYHTTLGFMPFVLASAGAVLIALVTVSFITWRTASGNPSRALRYE